MSNTKSTKHAVDFSKSDEVYFINAKCGQTLEVIDNRSWAIKTYILEYKNIVSDAVLILLKGGKKYLVNPSGKPADFVKSN